MIALILSLAYVGGIAALHAIPTSVSRSGGLDSAPLVACAGLAPEWVDEHQERVTDWWAERGCTVASYERTACTDTCDGLPCRAGAISIIELAPPPAGVERVAAERVHPGDGWAVVELPRFSRPTTDDFVPDLDALLLAHGLGHACGYRDGSTRIGLGRAVQLSRHGQVMSPDASALGWGDAGLTP